MKCPLTKDQQAVLIAVEFNHGRKMFDLGECIVPGLTPPQIRRALDGMARFGLIACGKATEDDNAPTVAWTLTEMGAWIGSMLREERNAITDFNTHLPQVRQFVEERNYRRVGPITEEEFSRAAFMKFGYFCTQDLKLSDIVFIANCAALTRLLPDKE